MALASPSRARRRTVPVAWGAKLAGVVGLTDADPAQSQSPALRPAEMDAVGIDPAGAARSLLEAQEAERGRIARELHDVVGQALTAVRLTLLSFRDVAMAPAASARLDESLAALDRAFQTVRTFAVDLRPPVLDDLGLEAAIRSALNRAARDGSFHATLSCQDMPPWLDPDVTIACFRVFQEALTNVARHARAQRVRVLLEVKGGTLEVIVEDDGVGFDVPLAVRGAELGQSMGLAGMSERARLLGGALEVRARPGIGTRVRASFPLARLDAQTPIRSA
jgi:signal transduction histidine kinase